MEGCPLSADHVIVISEDVGGGRIYDRRNKDIDDTISGPTANSDTWRHKQDQGAPQGVHSSHGAMPAVR